MKALQLEIYLHLPKNEEIPLSPESQNYAKIRRRAAMRQTVGDIWSLKHEKGASLIQSIYD
jgi:hypothetical protein